MYRREQRVESGRDYSSVAPPADLNKRTKCSISQSNVPVFGRQKKMKSDDDYFEDDDDDVQPQVTQQDDDSEEDDPLDAFMAGIEKEVKNASNKSGSNEVTPAPMSSKKPKDVKSLKGIRDDIEGEDAEESYYRYMEENPNAGVGTFANSDDDNENNLVEYDEDGNPIVSKSSKYIDPLPPIDHSLITYENFEKNFYVESEDIANLQPNEVNELRSRLGIKVLGLSPLKPVTSFGHFGFDEQLMKVIRKQEYTQPTPIQAQGIPIVLSGRDLIGVAKTGSGKTAAYIWPMLVHIMDQREIEVGEGPIGLILAPTRELSQQIYIEAKKFGKVYGVRVVCAYGGGNKWELSKDLEAGAEIVVATPGRMIDMIKMKATNLRRVTMLVLDEADRMFDMGFEPQVRSICDHVRPDRQTLMFSATFKKKVERVARDVLRDPIKVVQGELGEANEDVQQVIKVLSSGSEKWEWLTSKLVELTSIGSVLIFVTKKANADELATNLKNREYDVLLIHGDMEQAERNKVITAFKKKEVPILVATDVAARGLDIPHIRTVINYDIARDIDTHTHRIGRTGRAGEKGTAYTFVSDKDKEFAGHLVRNLEGANQFVPKALMDLAMQSSWFKKARFKQGNAKKLNVGGAGLGFKARPGFGAAKDASKSYSTSSSTYAEAIKSQMSVKESTSSGSSRITAMKAAFSAQYKSMFKQSSEDSLPSTRPDKPRKRSRWE